MMQKSAMHAGGVVRFVRSSEVAIVVAKCVCRARLSVEMFDVRGMTSGSRLPKKSDVNVKTEQLHLEV